MAAQTHGLTEEIKHENTTRGIKHWGLGGYSNILLRIKFGVTGQESSPQSPTISYRQPLAVMQKNRAPMKIFLKFKHWQLFLIWIFAEILFIATSSTSIWILTTGLFGFAIIGWIYSIGKVINNLNEKNRIENYKEDLWFILYLISVIPFGFLFRTFESSESMNGFLSFGAGLLGFISMIKLVNFSAKVFKQHESKRDLKFADYSNEFFLIVFMIIGIWIIQPKVNKIIDRK
jgi:uncharacterized membrane protein